MEEDLAEDATASRSRSLEDVGIGQGNDENKKQKTEISPPGNETSPAKLQRTGDSGEKEEAGRHAHAVAPVDLPRESKTLKVMDYRADELPVEKAVALTGACTFKEAAQHVNSGDITINGVKAHAGQLVSRSALLAHLGSPLPPRAPIVYYLLNKPRAVMTTVSDGPWKRSAEGGTVLDLVPDYPRVVPVGRLDYDSEGLLIMTNDGSFVTAATSPRYQLDKTYLALIESKRKDRYSGVPGEELLSKMVREGVEVHGARFQCQNLSVEGAESEEEKGTAARSWLRVVLQEGKKREVRRLLASVGYNVLRLVRVGIHNLHGPCEQQSTLSFDPQVGAGGRREERKVAIVEEEGRALQPGEMRLLSTAEVDSVFDHCRRLDAQLAV